MGAVGLVFRAGFRRRWRSWLAVALLISVVGGLVLAAAAAGRRTENAFPRFVAAHGFDSVVYATRPVPAVAHLPGVASATELIIPDAGNPTCDCAHLSTTTTSAWPSCRAGARRPSRSSPAGCPTRRSPTRCWRRSRCNRTTACTWVR